MRALRDAKAFTVLILAVCAIICSYTLPAPAGSSGAVSGVADTRAINTTSPVAGGGDLSADRTITFSNTYVDPSINGFRVSLTSLTPVTTADVASGTALYLCTYTSDRMSIWDGSEWDVLTTSTEPVVYLTGLTADTNYDVFAQDSAGSVTIDATLVAWTNDTTRATTLDEQDGVFTKGGDRTRRYIATVRATGAAAVDDTDVARFVYNAANRVPRRLLKKDATATWTYSTGTWRAARGQETNRVEFVRGLGLEPVVLRIVAGGEAGGDGPDLAVAIGLDRAGTDNTVSSSNRHDSGGRGKITYAEYEGYPSVGYHFAQWNEIMGGAGTATWYGTSGTYLSGIVGRVWQ